jgi:hypothetical protein
MDGHPSDTIPWRSVGIDAYGNVTFDGMKIMTMLFDERPSFDKIFAQACEEISCDINVVRVRLGGNENFVIWTHAGDVVM